jgi:hypothetical protein
VGPDHKRAGHGPVTGRSRAGHGPVTGWMPKAAVECGAAKGSGQTGAVMRERSNGSGQTESSSERTGWGQRPAGGARTGRLNVHSRSTACRRGRAGPRQSRGPSAGSARPESEPAGPPSGPGPGLTAATACRARSARWAGRTVQVGPLSLIARTWGGGGLPNRNRKSPPSPPLSLPRKHQPAATTTVPCGDGGPGNRGRPGPAGRPAGRPSRGIGEGSSGPPPHARLTAGPRGSEWRRPVRRWGLVGGRHQEGARDHALEEGVAEGRVGPAGVRGHPRPLPARRRRRWRRRRLAEFVVLLFAADGLAGAVPYRAPPAQENRGSGAEMAPTQDKYSPYTSGVVGLGTYVGASGDEIDEYTEHSRLAVPGLGVDSRHSRRLAKL